MPSWIAKGATQGDMAAPEVSTLRPPRLPTDLTGVTLQAQEQMPKRSRDQRPRSRPPRGPAGHASPPRRGAADFDLTGAAASAAMRGGIPARAHLDSVPPPPESRRSHSVFPEVGFVVDETARAQLEANLVNLANLRKQLTRQMQGQLVDLAVLIAERVIAKELETPGPTLRALVAEGLEALTHQDQLLIRLGQAFEPHLESLKSALSVQAPHAEVVMDGNLDPYACILHSELGRVDESIDQRLKTILGLAQETLAEADDE